MAITTPSKSPTRAFILAMIIPGLGHLYIGRYLLFLTFLALCNPWTALTTFFFIADLTGDGLHNWLTLMFFACAWISQAIDASLLATGRNRREAFRARRQARREARRRKRDA